MCIRTHGTWAALKENSNFYGENNAEAPFAACLQRTKA